MAFVFQYGSNTLETRLNSPKRLNGSAKFISVVRTSKKYNFAFTVWSKNNRCAAADYIQSIVINNDIEKNSKNWIIGNKESVKDHINDQIKYNEETTENYQRLNDLKRKAQILKEFDELLQKKSNILDEEIANKLLEISEDPLLKNDPNILRNIEDLRKKGYL